VFDVAEQYKRIRVCQINDLHQALKPLIAPALKMQSMSFEIGLYPEMEICNN
jgi:hypothetical protein